MTDPVLITPHAGRTVEAWAAALTGTDLVLDAAGLARFPCALLGALANGQRRACVLGLDPAQADALAAVGAGAVLDLGAPVAPTMPFAGSIRGDGTVVLRLLPSALTHPGMPGDAAKGWIEHLDLVAVEIDLGALPAVNSVVIAWTLQVAHQLQGVPLRIAGASRQVATQLQQLRLDRILSIAAVR